LHTQSSTWPGSGGGSEFTPDQIPGLRHTSLVVGKAYLFRTCCAFYVGRLTDVTQSEVVLEDAIRAAKIMAHAPSLPVELKNFSEHGMIKYPHGVHLSRRMVEEFCEWKGELFVYPVTCPRPPAVTEHTSDGGSADSSPVKAACPFPPRT
jgi:hypothetical protein